MLVLSRKSGERIQIGQDITITVTEIRGNRVRIGIDAPPGRRIVRQELLSKPEAAPERPAVAPNTGLGSWIDTVDCDELLAAI